MNKNCFKLPPKFLKKSLKNRGWTQEDLADILDVSTSSVSKIINGKKISYELLHYICIALNLDKEKFKQFIFKYNLELEENVDNTRISGSCETDDE